jgi:hypothetical protein
MCSGRWSNALNLNRKWNPDMSAYDLLVIDPQNEFPDIPNAAHATAVGQYPHASAGGGRTLPKP